MTVSQKLLKGMEVSDVTFRQYVKEEGKVLVVIYGNIRRIKHDMEGNYLYDFG